MDQLTTAENPYSSSQTFDAPPMVIETDAEVIRKAHIKNEASIKSIGILYYLGAISSILAGLMGIISVFSAGASGVAELAMASAVFSLLLILGAVQLTVAIGLRKLRPWARFTCIILSVIGLIGFPVGTILGAYILYLLLNKKAGMIFSPAYKDIVAATPHVKYKTPVAVWIILGIIVLVIAGVIVADLS